MSELLTRDAILSADDIQIEEVDARPWWPGIIRVQGLTGRERDEFERAQIDVNRKGDIKLNRTDIRATLVQLAAIDNDGKPIFTKADIPLLTQKSAAALDCVAEVVRRLSGISEADEDEMVKNSEATAGDDSSTG